jgi:hypothetical protein
MLAQRTLVDHRSVINFDGHPWLVDVSSDIATKCGYFIKGIRNAKTADHVASLDNVRVNNLRELQKEAGASNTLCAQATSPFKTLRLKNLQASSRLVELKLAHSGVLRTLAPSYQYMGVTNCGSSFTQSLLVQLS